MKIIQYTDNDEINKPITGNAHVYALEKHKQETPVLKETLIASYPNVFTEEVGKLDGEYHIRLDKSVQPVQHPPRRVQVALRAQLKQELDKLTKKDILVPVTTPTTWVSSMVVVPKKKWPATYLFRSEGP